MLTETGVLRLRSVHGTGKRDLAGRGMDAHKACSAADGLSGVIAMKEPAALRNSVGASDPERSLHAEERWSEPTSGGKSENQAKNRMPKMSPVRRMKISRDTGLTKNNYTVQKGKDGDQVHGSSIPQDKSQETKMIPRIRSTEIKIEMTSTGEHKKHNRAKRTISLKSTPKLQSIHGGHRPPSLI
jgi:hypothetical protein